MRGTGRAEVTITGLGVVSPIGVGLDAFAEALFAGRSAGRHVEGFDTREWRSLVCCPVSGFEPTDFMERRAAKRMDRAGHLGVAAAQLALRDAGLWASTTAATLIGVDPNRVAVVTGTCAPM